jgi:hypothetical protein
MKPSSRKQKLTYKGNPKLKAADVEIEYTEEQIQERIRCAMDPLYFLENYIWIVTLDPVEPEKLFKPYDFQKDVLHNFQANRFNIVKCSRQVGKTTIVCGYVLWSVIFQQNYKVLLVGDCGDTSKKILATIKFAYENLPMWLQQGVKEWNKSRFEIENGSEVKAATTTKKSGRGGSFNLVVLEEFAFVDAEIADFFLSSVFPVISSGPTTKIFVISTPLGQNFFYDMWNAAINGNSLFVPSEAHWSQVPGRDEAWHKTQLALLGEEKFNQEYGGDFNTSVRTLLPGEYLKSVSSSQAIVSTKNLKVYERAQPDHLYIITVDLSENRGLDYTAIQVIDATNLPYRQVACWRSNDEPEILVPSAIVDLAKAYNDAFILVEVNTGDKIPYIIWHELEYGNLLCCQNFGRGGQKLSYGPTKNRSRFGLKTTEPTKILATGTLKAMLTEHQLILQDFETIAELGTYIKAPDKSKSKKGYGAEKGKNDDLVAALLLFAWMTNDQLFKDLTNTDIRKQLIAERQQNTQNDVNTIHEEKKDSFVSDGMVWTTIGSLHSSTKTLIRHGY